MTVVLTTLRGSPNVQIGGKSRDYVNLGGPEVTAVIEPVMSQLIDGQAVEDVTNWATFISTSNYETPEGTIVSATPAFIGENAPAAADEALSEGDEVGFRIAVLHSSGFTTFFTADAITVYPQAPSVAVAATSDGDPVVGENLDGGDAEFNGSGVTITREWEISDNGSDWTGTGNTTLTSPSLVLAKYYRLRSEGENITDTATSYSEAVGPVVVPTISIVGLTGGKAVPGSTLTMTTNLGTITARKWGSTSGGSEYGTGANPSTFSSGTLYATATVGGNDYTVSAPIEASETASETLYITSLIPGAYDSGEIPVNVAAEGITNGDDIQLVLIPDGATTPTIADVQAGTAYGGAAALDDWSTTWNDSTPATLSVAGGIARGLKRLAAVADDDVAPSAVFLSNAFLLSTTAAAISVGTPTVDEEDVDADITSDLAVGTIYAAIRDSGDSQLSASNIINGTGDAIDTDSVSSPTADDSNTVAFTGLGNGTYVIDAVQVDDFGNVSSVASSASFEIDVASSFSVTPVLDGDYTTGDGGPIADTVPAGTPNATKRVYLALPYSQAGAGTLTVTLGGSAPDATLGSVTTSNLALMTILRWDTPSGGNLALSISNTTNFAGVSYRAWVATDVTTETFDSASSASYGALDVSNSVVTGNEIIGCAGLGSNGTTGTLSLVGLTEDQEYVDHKGNRSQFIVSATADATETRTMTLTPTGDGSGQAHAAIAILT